MAEGILTVSSHPRNLVSSIAQFFHKSLQKHCDHPIDFYIEDYGQGIATLTGLGFTAILAEGKYVRSSRLHFATVVRYRHFTQHVDKLKSLSYAIAKLIYRAIPSFEALQAPRYYDDFITVLVHIIKSSCVNDPETEKEIRRTMQAVFFYHSD